jgi:catechol 2,3-dioxygenase-like lactoylglutathione lyase family enzyme
MINGVHHISLSTGYLDRLVGFYRDLLGLTQIGEGRIDPGFTPFEAVVGLRDVRVRVAQLRAGNLHIEMFEYEHPAPAPGQSLRACDVGIRHICFDVTDIDAEYTRLKAAGVAAISEPQTIGDTGVRAVYLRDPDDNIVELQEVYPGSIVDRSHVAP